MSECRSACRSSFTARSGRLAARAAAPLVTSTQSLGNDGAFAGHDEGSDLGGASIKRTVTLDYGAPELMVDAKVGFGQLDIQQVTP